MLSRIVKHCAAGGRDAQKVCVLGGVAPVSCPASNPTLPLPRGLTVVGAAALPTLPHLVIASPPAGALLGVVCYVPMLVFLAQSQRSVVPAVALGAAHGALLAGAAGWWTFTLKALPIAVPIIAVLASSLYYALTLGATTVAVRLIVGDGVLRQLGRLGIGVILLAGAELGRSVSAEATLPLGTLYLALSAPPFLPLAYFGIACLSVFAFALNGAVASLLFPALRRIALLALALLGCVLTAVNLFARGQSGTGLPAGLTLCAYRDTARRQLGESPYMTALVLETKVISARTAGCDIVAFPELTAAIELDAAPPLARTDSIARPPAIILGARLATEIKDRRPLLGDGSANSVCLATVGGERIGCLQRVDKRFLIPFVEANVFHRVPALRGLGSRLTEAVMGVANPTEASPGPTVLEVQPGLKIGILNCVEIFLPLYRQRDGVGRPLQPNLVVAVADHSGFLPARTVRTLGRDAARLQSVAARTPLLYVSTEDAALFTLTGVVVAPAIQLEDFFLWRV
jgi:apolipoprotein N-acyltransferase